MKIPFNIDNLLSGGDKKHTGPIHMSAPDAFIRVFSWKQQYTLNKSMDPDGSDSVSFNIYGDIVSIQTDKHKEAAASWNITLAPGKEYNTIVHPGDWITIHISDQKINYTNEVEYRKTLKMVGIVRTVRKIESSNPETGQRYTKYVLAGNDFSSALHMPIYINNAVLNSTSDALQGQKAATLLSIMTSKTNDNPYGNPTQNVASCLQLIFGGGGDKEVAMYETVGYQFKVPEELFKAIHGHGYSFHGTSFLNFVDKDFQGNLHGSADIRPNLGGVVDGWSLIKAYSNPVVNEFYADLFIKKDADHGFVSHPTLVLRAMPYSSKKKGDRLSIKDGLNPGPKAGDNKLYLSKEIQESEILNLNFGRSDADRFNFWLVVPNQAAMEKFYKDTLETVLNSLSRGSHPAISVLSHLESINRYGLRPFVTNSMYQIDDENAYEIMYRQARDMWDDAVFMENGVVELIGCAEHIAVGTNIKFAERAWVAHVEGVGYNYYVDAGSGKKTFKTSINFIRLQDESGNPLFVDTTRDRTGLDPGLTRWPDDDDVDKTSTKPWAAPKMSVGTSGTTGKPKNKSTKKKGKKDKAET